MTLAPEARLPTRVRTPASAQIAMRVDMESAKLDFALRNLDETMRAARQAIPNHPGAKPAPDHRLMEEHPMSHANVTLDQAHRSARGHGLLFGLKTMLLVLLTLVSQGAWADPVAAEPLLHSAKQVHAELKLQHQIAKLQLQAGQTNAAVTTLTVERFKAGQLLNKLKSLYVENVDTFQRGLYVNGAAQEQAITRNDIAKNDAWTLDIQLAVLIAQPTSASQMVTVEYTMQLLEIRMTQLEQAMVAAQQ